MTHKAHLTAADLKVGDTFHAWQGKCCRTVLGLRRMLNWVDIDVAAPGSTAKLGTWHLLATEQLEVER